MKEAVINHTHRIWVPDNVADWDAISDWERPRIASILEHLHPGETLFDIGVEHGWMSVIFGQHVGGENMVLVEPSPEFWPNIRMGWEMNHLADPAACWVGFAGMMNEGQFPERPLPAHVWPDASEGPECDAMAYRTIFNHSPMLPTITIDSLVLFARRAPKGITIDVEGAEVLVIGGAWETLIHDKPFVWISVHPDLMERDFGHRPDDLIELFDDAGYVGAHLATDHEQHWLFTPREWGL